MKSLWKFQETMLKQQEPYYKLIGIDLKKKKKKKPSISQQIHFNEKAEKDDSAKMFSIIKKQQIAILNFYLDLLDISG